MKIKKIILLPFIDYNHKKVTGFLLYLRYEFQRTHKDR